ncbi:MAG: helix-turn-helix domain-containing protein, partial [Planctomycetota bacterium]
QARLEADHRRAMAAKEAELKHAEKLARIEAKKVSATVSSTVPKLSQNVSQEKTLETLKTEIIAELGQEKPNMSQLARRLDIGRGTLYRHLGTLAETGQVIKNGNGYELAKK